jgi:hypothetical protein
LLDLLDDWLTLSSNVGRLITTGDLFKELQGMPGSSLRSFPFKDPQAFGQHVSSLDTTLRRLYKMQSSQMRSNRRQCAFWPRIQEAA